MTWEAARPEIVSNLIILLVMYVLALILSVVETQIMAVMTQGYLDKLRKEMFGGMQRLPIKYFDTHKHGDIMSHYTNDSDTLRQLVSQAFPALLRCGTIVLGVFALMLWYSIWMTLVLVAGVFLMFFLTKFVGGGSAKYFVRQQEAVGKTEGYIQEMVNGQKVVKVFNHEQKSIDEFDKINNSLYEDSWRANAYANVLAPIIGNIGNIIYVVLAIVGGLLIDKREYTLCTCTSHYD